MYIKNMPTIVFILFAILASLFIYFYINSMNYKTDSQKVTNMPSVTINNKKINIEVADDPIEKAQGLSGKKSLDEGAGMLFVWESKVKPGFWMPDMNFAIDIIWISDNKIVSIDKNVLPEPGVSLNKLKKYYPSEPVNFVLEVNAGFSDKQNLKIGDTVKIEL